MEKKHVLSILADNNSGVLIRISGLFSRRGYSIESISAAQTENPNISRMTIVTTGDESTLEQIDKQLSKLVDVKEIRVLTNQNSVMREHVILTAGSSEETRSALIQVSNLFRANILSVDDDSLMLELTGKPDKVEAFIRLIKPYGIKKLVKTGLSALERNETAE